MNTGIIRVPLHLLCNTVVADAACEMLNFNCQHKVEHSQALLNISNMTPHLS